MFTHLVGSRARELNDVLSQGGFRRSQSIAYRPACETCRACISVRIVVADFRPSRTFRKILSHNSDLIGEALPPQPRSEHYSLFRGYLDERHPDGGMATMSALDFAMTVPGLLIPPLISTGDELRGLIDSGATPYLEKHGDWVRTFLDLSPAAANPSLQMGAVENKKVDKVSNPAPWGSEIWTSPPIDGQMVQQVLINKVDPEQAWTEAVSRIEGIRESWLADNPDWKPTS